ncbi:MAG: endonuclease/exonuclease/phosphatase family protein [Verrucomicrobia bacterium]|nr:endonuclease/exonuclease/phosphatase family protein [Verrucomicrobiota bacterium]
MRLISWNTNRSARDRIEKQVKVLCARKPDVLALQEVTPKAAEIFREQLERMGWKHIVDSFPRRGSGRLKNGRQYGELIASQWKLKQIASTEFGVPWPEKVLSVVIKTELGDVEIHSVHVPNGSEHGRVKTDTFEAIYKRLARNPRRHRILCGDFNSPQEETPDGQLITWGQNKNADGRFVIGKRKWDGITDERWDLAERCVLEGLRRYDLNDVFRSKHGYRKKAFSFFTNNRGRRVGRRFDHIFASSALKIVACEYLQQLRRLSDHAPMEAVFNL